MRENGTNGRTPNKEVKERERGLGKEKGKYNMCQKELQYKKTTSSRKSRDKEIHAGKKTFGKKKDINKIENNSR